MISVIEVAGKQYVIKPGQTLKVNRLATPVGESVQFSDMLGNNTVAAQVVSHIAGPKVTSRKFRNKTRYHRVKGHRQPLTVLQFASVETKATPETTSKTIRAKKKSEAAAEAVVTAA